MLSAVVTTTSFAAQSGKGIVYFHDTTMNDPEQVIVGPAQRCYSFSCYSNSPLFIEWRGMQSVSVVAFYDDPGCRGNFLNGSGHSDELELSDTSMDNRASSIMVLESGSYPTRGFMDVCPDRK